MGKAGFVRAFNSVYTGLCSSKWALSQDQCAKPAGTRRSPIDGMCAPHRAAPSQAVLTSSDDNSIVSRAPWLIAPWEYRTLGMNGRRKARQMAVNLRIKKCTGNL